MNEVLRGCDWRRAAVLAAGLVVGCSCKSAPQTCQQQVAACLRRCDASGADPKPAPGAPPEDKMSLCEKMCQHCHPEAAAAPAGAPTYTGSAKP